jgi:uncharacterized membrane protein YccC
MLDRLSQLMPRLATADAENDTTAVRLLAELRVGFNIVDLRRARHTLPDTARAAVDAMLDRLAAYFHQRASGLPADPAPLLDHIDAALTAIAALPDGDGRRDGLLGLVGIRCAMLPEAPPYRPPTAPATPAPREAERAA